MSDMADCVDRKAGELVAACMRYLAKAAEAFAQMTE